MALDPDALLAGPRGRRLCLEFALRWAHAEAASVDALRQAVLFAAYHLDPGSGTSVVMFSPAHETKRQPIPTPSPQQVATLLTVVPLAPPDGRRLLEALDAAVANARYWQEPDGEDVLAAMPELREPLARVAVHLLDSPATAWWSTPMDTTRQFVTTFAAPAAPEQPEKSAAVVLQQWRTAQLEEEADAARTRSSAPVGRWSGTWWSKPPIRLLHTTRSLADRSPAGLWLVEDSGGWEAASVERIHLPTEARIFEIQEPGHWVELCRRYPMTVTASRRQDWYRTTGRNGRWVIPDWSRAQHDVDAVHLSVAGYLTTAGRALPVQDDLATVLAGWDPDQTFWLRDVARDSSSHEAWTFDRESENWSPSIVP